MVSQRLLYYEPSSVFPAFILGRRSFRGRTRRVGAHFNYSFLSTGLYGFDVRGPFLGLEIHYWAATLDILRKKVGAEVIVRGVPG